MKKLTSVTPELVGSRLNYFFRNPAFQPEYKNLSPLKVGICVSGGPDSMALAYLLKHVNYPQAPNIPAFEPLCFIVDHGARSGSRDEARQVQESLSKLGLRSQILQIEWSRGVEPLKLPNFESEARRERYRLIARSSVIAKIQHIFLGHHQDDQIETLLVRLMQKGSKSLLGLQGIAKTSSLPCCEDVVESQSTLSSKELLHRMDHSQSSQSINGSTHWLRGIRVHRPLLDFSKEQLLATCYDYQIPFVTDQTNFDPTTTIRNAVRHMRKYHRLPQALQNERILFLHHNALSYRENIVAQGLMALKNIKVLRVEHRSGILEFELPKLSAILDLQKLIAFSYALARITELVTPNSREDSPTLMDVRITRKLLWPEEGDVNQSLQFARVNFTKLSSQLQTFTKNSAWRLSRQPMRKTERKINTKSFKADIRKDADSLHESQWLFWDCRYWIQILQQEPDQISKVCIRPYSEDDVPALKTQLARQARLEAFNKLLNDVAPGKIRYTLPVLTRDREIMAFPTLDFSIGEREELMWNVRYPMTTALCSYFETSREVN